MPHPQGSGLRGCLEAGEIPADGPTCPGVASDQPFGQRVDLGEQPPDAPSFLYPGLDLLYHVDRYIDHLGPALHLAGQHMRDMPGLGILRAATVLPPALALDSHDATGPGVPAARGLPPPAGYDARAKRRCPMRPKLSTSSRASWAASSRALSRRRSRPPLQAALGGGAAEELLPDRFALPVGEGGGYVVANSKPGSMRSAPLGISGLRELEIRSRR